MKRTLLAMVAMFPMFSQSLAAEPASTSGALRVYLGTYTTRGSKGIYQARFDPAQGSLSAPELAAELANPSFVALHPTRPLLYAVGELGTFQGKRVGAVSALAIDRASGKLTLLNQQSSGGGGPCHLTVDRSGRCVLVANYGGGSIASLPILEDGRLGEAASVIQHEGSGPNTRRQEKAHAHGIYTDAANRFVFVPDLGMDKVMIYRLDAPKATLAPNAPPSASTPAGAGPRHFAFHPDGKRAYVINELDSTLTSFRYDAAAGKLDVVETVSTLPAGFAGTNYPAEVAVHPSGRFVYGSNRGQDAIVAYAIDPQSGKLAPVDHEPTQGKNPRSFAIDPAGQWLLAANQDGDNVVVLRIDPGTGKLSPTGQSIKLSMPVCVEFAPAG